MEINQNFLDKFIEDERNMNNIKNQAEEIVFNEMLNA